MYIYLKSGECYSPGESLQLLLERQIILPFREKLPHIAELFDRGNWDELEYLRGKILSRGGTDFDVGKTDDRYRHFTPEHKVLFYCANYLPMHLYSSYHIYSTHLLPLERLIGSKHIVFIDFGCGPLTSGIAFWDAAYRRDITYIGIDISQNMLNKARQINRDSPDGNGNPYYKNIRLAPSYSVIPSLLEDIETPHADTLIIFNFCYSLAPSTFKGDINSFISVLHRAVYVSSKYKMCMVYQNPADYSEAHKHWHKFRDEEKVYNLHGLASVVQKDKEIISYEALLPRWTAEVKEDDLPAGFDPATLELLSRPPAEVKVHYEIICNWLFRKELGHGSKTITTTTQR